MKDTQKATVDTVPPLPRRQPGTHWIEPDPRSGSRPVLFLGDRPLSSRARPAYVAYYVPPGRAAGWQRAADLIDHPSAIRSTGGR
ncbi:hypothetical protein [Kitasatospora sp. NPDC059817]|uniref:hypothetical protein n=1 Tax=Kitasatospora sp. NPDC059817 TaxID=3346961 RepID=UPI003647C9D5